MLTRGRERTETLLEKALFASRWLLPHSIWVSH
jgi:hypothetical protein